MTEKGATGNLFFSFFQKKKCFLKNGQHFPTTTKKNVWKKKIAAARLDRKQTFFFYGQTKLSGSLNLYSGMRKECKTILIHQFRKLQAVFGGGGDETP